VVGAALPLPFAFTLITVHVIVIVQLLFLSIVHLFTTPLVNQASRRLEFQQFLVVLVLIPQLFPLQVTQSAPLVVAEIAPNGAEVLHVVSSRSEHGLCRQHIDSHEPQSSTLSVNTSHHLTQWYIVLTY